MNKVTNPKNKGPNKAQFQISPYFNYKFLLAKLLMQDHGFTAQHIIYLDSDIRKSWRVITDAELRIFHTMFFTRNKTIPDELFQFMERKTLEMSKLKPTHQSKAANISQRVINSSSLVDHSPKRRHNSPSRGEGNKNDQVSLVKKMRDGRRKTSIEKQGREQKGRSVEVVEPVVKKSPGRPKKDDLSPKKKSFKSKPKSEEVVEIQNEESEEELLESKERLVGSARGKGRGRGRGDVGKSSVSRSASFRGRGRGKGRGQVTGTGISQVSQNSPENEVPEKTPKKRGRKPHPKENISIENEEALESSSKSILEQKPKLKKKLRSGKSPVQQSIEDQAKSPRRKNNKRMVEVSPEFSEKYVEKSPQSVVKAKRKYERKQPVTPNQQCKSPSNLKSKSPVQSISKSKSPEGASELVNHRPGRPFKVDSIPKVLQRSPKKVLKKLKPIDRSVSRSREKRFSKKTEFYVPEYPNAYLNNKK